jgi:PAS domain S-box-containing protein
MPPTMRDEPPAPLTEINSGRRPGMGLSTPIALLLFPVIVAGLVTVFLAVAAALAGWHRDLMLLIAASVGALLLAPALVLLLRMRRESGAIRGELQGMQARVGGLVESAMDAIITIDESQRIVHFNAAAEKAFKWPRRAVLGQPIETLIPQRFRGPHRSHVERFGATAATSRGMGSQTVLYALRADGTEFPIEASISQHEQGGHRLLTVILRDITRRLESAQALERSEARMRGILDSAMDAIITVDDRQHVVLFNAAAEAVFGCPRDQAVGAPLDWFIPERFRPGHRELVRRFGESTETSRRMGHARVVMGLRRNGEEFPIEASISHTSEDGQRFYTVILRDVTERVRAEEALKRSQVEIQALAIAASTAREQEKSRIARELHDELGQALTALKIDVGWLRENGGKPSQERLDKLAGMQRLLDSTVAAARRISADLRPMMLDDLGLVAASEWLVENFTQRTGIPCELVMGAGNLDLADPHATTVFRTLQESLTNAAKHSQATQVEVALERDNGDIVLTVSDNGAGFLTGAARKPGSFGQIGLRERAYHLGGNVTFESAPGKGTRVELRIPAPEGSRE